MKVKDLHGNWKQVTLNITISVEGELTKETEEIIKMLEDFMSTTLVIPRRLVASSSENRIQMLPYPISRRTLTYSRVL